MCLGGHLVSDPFMPLSHLRAQPSLLIRLLPTGLPCEPLISYVCNALFVNVFQAAFDPRVLSAVCFFATDIHGATLGKGGDDSLARVRAGELTGKGELVVQTPCVGFPQSSMMFTDDIRKAGYPRSACWQRSHPQDPRRCQRPRLCPFFLFLPPVSPSKLFQFLEVQAQHAFIRDESSKGRWDAALTRSLFGFMMEVFERTVGRDLGPKIEGSKGVEHIC
jgi:carboxymethylenebutenolidase